VGSGLRQVLLGWILAQFFSLPHSDFRGAEKNSSVEAERVMPLYKQEKGVSLMAITTENETALVNEETLARHWKERCASGQFSQAVLGLGTIRVMGKAGDAAVQFPRIPSLDILGTLEPDERWAVQAAQAIVTQACIQRRTVLATASLQASVLPTPRVVTAFDPSIETQLVTSMIRGG
jgi:hypothetical protein